MPAKEVNSIINPVKPRKNSPIPEIIQTVDNSTDDDFESTIVCNVLSRQKTFVKQPIEVYNYTVIYTISNARTMFIKSKDSPVYKFAGKQIAETEYRFVLDIWIKQPKEYKSKRKKKIVKRSNNEWIPVIKIRHPVEVFASQMDILN